MSFITGRYFWPVFFFWTTQKLPLIFKINIFHLKYYCKLLSNITKQQNILFMSIKYTHNMLDKVLISGQCANQHCEQLTFLFAVFIIGIYPLHNTDQREHCRIPRGICETINISTRKAITFSSVKYQRGYFCTGFNLMSKTNTNP